MSDSVDDASPARFRELRARLVADHTVDGSTFRRRCTALTDRWLVAVFDQAMQSPGIDAGIGELALVALGGYGRAELCPGSDIDLLLLHRKGTKAAKAAEAVWYPIWDSGLKLGHALRSVSESADLAASDVESATAMLDARLLCGDEAVFAELMTVVGQRWQHDRNRTIPWFHADVHSRRERFSDVAYAVEPNLKQGHGGLRDAQVPTWLDRDDPVLVGDDVERLARSVLSLLDVRVALHRCSPGSGDVLHLDDQDQVARLLGESDADALMGRVSRAARDVSWVTDELWEEVDADTTGKSRRRRSHGALAPLDRLPTLTDATNPVDVLRVAAATAAAGHRLARADLDRIAEQMVPIGGPWPPDAREAFVALLAAGAGAVPVIESLDHVGVWERILPEWIGVQCRPQRTTHHRFTVDRHLLETVAVAATLTSRVSRPDLLLLAALFHDLGKGRSGDHSEIGVALSRDLARRIGLDDEDTEIVATLVRHHLLLPEVATRRDLGDPATLDLVAAAVGSVDVLGMLVVLTEADARATGPTAWTDWRVGLVRTLVERTSWRLQGDRRDQYGPMFPSVEQMLLLRAGITSIEGDGRAITVVAPDKPGLFSRVAGALVLRGLDVISAEVTTSDGMALEEFTVASAFANAALVGEVPIDWDRVVVDIERALAGRLAIEARVADRASTYRRRRRSADTEIRIRFDDAVDDVTLLEVDAPDAVGLLYRVTRALSDLRIDIRQARVETQTDRVIDAFSIVDSDGLPIVDADYRVEIARAVRHAVGG